MRGKIGALMVCSQSGVSGPELQAWEALSERADDNTTSKKCDDAPEHISASLKSHH